MLEGLWAQQLGPRVIVSLQVISNFVQLLESATYTFRLSTWVYTHLPGEVEKKKKKRKN